MQREKPPVNTRTNRPPAVSEASDSRFICLKGSWKLRSLLTVSKKFTQRNSVLQIELGKPLQCINIELKPDIYLYSRKDHNSLYLSKGKIPDGALGGDGNQVELHGKEMARLLFL